MVLSISALAGCLSETAYTMPASALKKVSNPGMESFFIVPANNVIEPVPYDGWFVSSRFIRELAIVYDRAGAFNWLSPEYCSLIWINVAPPMMVHASKLVSYDLYTGDGTFKCPPIAGLDVTAGQGHSHQIPKGLSLGDSLLTNIAMRKSGEHTYVPAVVMFSDSDYSLAGINPETHRREPVPQQNFLFFKVHGEVRSYMWVPLQLSQGLRSLVQVYVPDGVDGWRKAARCWVTDGAYQAWLPKSKQHMPDAECDDETIWQ